MNDIPDNLQGVERRLFAKAMSNRSPIYGNLELTPLCNMNCEMCFIRLSHDEMQSRGRLRSIEEFLRLVDEMREAGVLFIQLTGGEPLLYKDFRQLYLYLLESGFVVTVNTNGTLVDDDWADFFGTHPPRRINITLYGSDNATYQSLCHLDQGFDRAMAGIRRLKERKVMVKLNYSVTRLNHNQVDQVVDLANQLQVPISIDTYMYPSVRERSRPYHHDTRISPLDMALLDEKINKLKFLGSHYHDYCAFRLKQIEERDVQEKDAHPMHFNCNAGRCTFIVNWQGMIRPCIMLDSPSVDVFQQGFSKGWSMISEAAKQVTFSPACSTCKLMPVCKVCAASAILETGNNHDRPLYLCQAAEATKEIISKK